MEGIPFTAFCYYLNILIFALEKEKPDVGTSDDSDFDLIFVFKYHLGAPNCHAKWNKERAPPCNKIKFTAKLRHFNKDVVFLHILFSNERKNERHIARCVRFSRIYAYLHQFIDEILQCLF